MMIDTGSDHRWQGRAMSIPLQRCIDCIHFRYTSTIDNSSIIQTLILLSLCSYPVCKQEALLIYIQHNYMQHMKPIRHERLLESLSAISWTRYAYALPPKVLLLRGYKNGQSTINILSLSYFKETK